MSDYISMKSIQLKNQIMLPEVLRAYRDGTLSYKTMQDTSSPIQEIYAKTYQYLQYPDLTQEAKTTMNLVIPKPIGNKINNDDVLYRVSQNILPQKRY